MGSGQALIGLTKGFGMRLDGEPEAPDGTT
jgi:hypothetical protein